MPCSSVSCLTRESLMLFSIDRFSRGPSKNLYFYGFEEGFSQRSKGGGEMGFERKHIRIMFVNSGE